MELKELSTEEALMRTLSTELGNEVEPISTPGKCDLVIWINPFGIYRYLNYSHSQRIQSNFCG